MKTIPFFQVNAFTRERFRGNTAGVCLLEGFNGEAPGKGDAGWTQDVGSAQDMGSGLVPFDDASLLQSIATENNHPATAFVRRTAAGFSLRWFSPSKELPLCGHGTLAAAHVLMEQGLLTTTQPAVFDTKGGLLTVNLQDGGWLEMAFPLFSLEPAELPVAIMRSFDAQPRSVWFAQDRFLVELASEADVRGYEPDFALLKEHRMIITANTATKTNAAVADGASGEPAIARPGESASYDFVSRFFGVPYGVGEDAVTGSAHCALAPYWAERLGKTTLNAYQASARGGALKVRPEDDKVFIAGQALTVVRGRIDL